ncbi:MAG: hypothetical protein KTR15_08980 [Phycisphaeraceae bacterium]|nr:hypothetical protein [Phycisphaeraceae bacterium]
MGFCLLLVVVCAALAACGSRRGYTNENDKLRAERLSLQEQIDELQNKLALREGELQATREQLGDPLPPAEGVEPPRLAGIVLGLYSGPIDLDGDARYDALRVYVRPVDQHSRQMTAKGTARVRLIATPADGEPKTILDQTYGPDAFHAAYRSGVTGTHYTLKAGLPEGRPTNATLHVALTDAATGRVFKAKKEVVLVRTAPEAEPEK